MNRLWDWSVIGRATGPDALTALNKVVDALNLRGKDLARALRAPQRPFFPLVAGFGASVTPDLTKATLQRIVVTDGVAFGITVPKNLLVGRPNDLQIGFDFYLDILNASGGAMGVVTFDPIYRMDASYANPANTKRRTGHFYYDGVNLVLLGTWSGDL